MKQPTEQQLKDPKWWDENDPSKGEATHFDVADGSESSWMRFDSGEWTYWFGAWGKTSQPLGRMIPRPQPTPWQGPQDGLPPVGTWCEVGEDIPEQGNRIYIFAHHDGNAFGWDAKKDAAFHGSDPRDFRPIQSERDKAVAEMWYLMDECDRGLSSMAEKLYDAGYRKLMSRAEANNAISIALSDVPFSVKHRTALLDALGYKE